MLLGRGSGCSVCFLPSAFVLIFWSGFRANAHDDAHHIFMTLPAYTSSREGEAPELRCSPNPDQSGAWSEERPSMDENQKKPAERILVVQGRVQLAGRKPPGGCHRQKGEICDA